MTSTEQANVTVDDAMFDWHLVDPRRGTLRGKVIGHIRLARPAQLLWLDICLSLCIFVGIVGEMPPAFYLWFVLTAVLIDAGACTINDIGDLACDKMSTEGNRSERPLVTGTISSRAAWTQGILLFTAGAILAAWLSIWVLLFALLLVVLSYQYSFPPMRMDAKPYVQQLFWFTFGILYFLAVYSYVIAYSQPMEDFWIAAISMIIGVQVFAALGETLAKDLRDLDNDRAGGKYTTSVHLGPKRTARYAFYLSCAGLFIWISSIIFLYDNWGIAALVMAIIAILWTVICFQLVSELTNNYSKASARKLHLGFISVFALLLILSMLSFV
ncbi:MAG: UbiA family prenyltransferase [Candidatus Thermoplasmatota archaeon]|nr:UbiA family prenyltransferase [Candidatus Thermoplasmatota archaeon]